MLCFVGCEQNVIITTSEIEIDDETQNTQSTSQIIDLSDQEGYIIDGSFCIINDKTYNNLKFSSNDSNRLNKKIDVYYSKEGRFKFDSHTGQLLYMNLSYNAKEIAKEDNITKEQAEKIADDFVNRIYKTDGFEKTVHTPDRKIGKDGHESGKYDIYYTSKYLGATYESMSISMLPDGTIEEFSATLDFSGIIKTVKNIEQTDEERIKTAFFDYFGEQYSPRTYMFSKSWRISDNNKPAFNISACDVERSQKNEYYGCSYIMAELINDGYNFYEYSYTSH